MAEARGEHGTRDSHAPGELADAPGVGERIANIWIPREAAVRSARDEVQAVQTNGHEPHVSVEANSLL